MEYRSTRPVTSDKRLWVRVQRYLPRDRSPSYEHAQPDYTLFHVDFALAQASTFCASVAPGTLACAMVAFTKPIKSGCGRATVLLYSGWYCTPTNQG